MQNLLACINLLHTLDSGQIFRYHKEGEGYRIIHGKHAFFVQAKGRKLFFQDIPKKDLKIFFRLDDDYDAVIKAIQKDSTIHQAIQQYYGLRILRQDPWECTIAFLCSSATNIPRIKKVLENIARIFGEERDGFFLFPKIGEIDNWKKLKQCNAGFRGKYIYEVNSMVTPSFFRKLKRKSYEEAKAVLMELPGVGEKIADCILLFSLDYLHAFPIDVWMERVLREHYLQKKMSYKQIVAFAQQYFGEYAGYAQQFLYHWRRCLKK